MDPALELRLFGPVALARGVAVLDLRSRKALALLALLAVDGARPREALAALLWPRHDPASARRNLRREVFRLRDLGVPFDDGDAHRLALAAPLAVVDDGSGEPLAWVEGGNDDDLGEWLHDRRNALASRRRRRRLAEAQRLIGQAASAPAIDLLGPLLDSDPCDEEALGLAMQALAAAGQPARALTWYERGAAALRERLGSEPAAALQALAASLRTPSKRATLAPASPLFAGRVPFVPRAAPAAAILGAWQRRQPVWLAGVSGAGKSRLAAECAATRGPWLQVASQPSDRGQPYASVLRVLRALRDAAPDVVLPGWVRRELSQLLPELGPPPAPAITGEARTRLLAGVDAALARLAAGNFAALVLDDWQWADDTSAAIWAAFDVAALPLSLLTCFRSAQLPPPALAQLRREVDAGRAALVELRGFDADETLALTHALSSSPGGRLFSQRLQAATDGNPFFLIETLRHLHQQALLQIDAQGRWSTPFDEATEDYAELPVPASVRDAVLARVRALGSAGERVLQAASLHDGALDAGLLAEVAEADLAIVQSLLEHAGAARLLDDDGGAWVFAHDLVRQCLAEAQPPRRRRQWHRRLAAALESRGAAPVLLARHHEAAGDPANAVVHRLRAGDDAWRVHALGQAAEQWRAALADTPTPEQAVQAWLALAGLHRREADLAAAEAATAAALSAAADAGTDVRRRARLACAELWVAAHRAEAAAPLLAALEADLAAAPALERARALNLHATLAAWGGRHDDAVQLYERAFAALAGVADALVPLGDMLDSAARSMINAGRLPQAQAFARRAVATLEAAGEPAELAPALVIDGVCALYVQGDAEAARQRFERARALARRCGLVPTQRAAILNMVKLHADAGRSSEALALLDEGEALAPGFEHTAAEQHFLQSRYYLHCLRGEVEAADAAARKLVAMSRRVADRHILLESLILVADLPIHRRRFDDAAALLDEAAALIEGDAGNTNHTMVASKRAWLALERGDPERARSLLPAPDTSARSEARVLRAWVGAAVALAAGDTAVARRELHDFPPASPGPTNFIAMLLVQHLALAGISGAPGADATAARARALLAAGAVPAAEAQRLRAALAAPAPINAGSTPPA